MAPGPQSLALQHTSTALHTGLRQAGHPGSKMARRLAGLPSLR